MPDIRVEQKEKTLWQKDKEYMEKKVDQKIEKTNTDFREIFVKSCDKYINR